MTHMYGLSCQSTVVDPKSDCCMQTVLPRFYTCRFSRSVCLSLKLPPSPKQRWPVFCHSSLPTYYSICRQQTRSRSNEALKREPSSCLLRRILKRHRPVADKHGLVPRHSSSNPTTAAETLRWSGANSIVWVRDQTNIQVHVCPINYNYAQLTSSNY